MNDFDVFRAHCLRYLRVEWPEAWLAERMERVERYIGCAYVRGVDPKSTAQQMLRGHMSKSGFWK